MAKPSAKRAARGAGTARAIVQPMVNPERGEHDLTLAGVTYRLRPSHAAVKAIEKKTEKSTLTLVRLADGGDLSIESLGIVAAELIRAGAEDELTRNVGAERISELIYEEGLPTVTARLALCLLDAATGGRTAEERGGDGSVDDKSRWRRLMGVAQDAFGMSADAFWSATAYEFWSMIEARHEANKR